MVRLKEALLDKPKGLRTYKVEEGFRLFTTEEIESMLEPREAVKTPVKRLRNEICVYCANKSKDVCQPCGERGEYREFVAEPLKRGEPIPKLPPFRELVTWPGYAKLAILYQVIEYLTRVVDG